MYACHSLGGSQASMAFGLRGSLLHGIVPSSGVTQEENGAQTGCTNSSLCFIYASTLLPRLLVCAFNGHISVSWQGYEKCNLT